MGLAFSRLLRGISGGVFCLIVAGCAVDKPPPTLEAPAPNVSPEKEPEYRHKVHEAQGAWSLGPNCLASVTTDWFKLSFQGNGSLIDYTAFCLPQSGKACASSRLRLRFSNESVLWFHNIPRRRASVFTSRLVKNDKVQSELLVALEGGNFDLYTVSRSLDHIGRVHVRPGGDAAAQWFSCLRKR